MSERRIDKSNPNKKIPGDIFSTFFGTQEPKRVIRIVQEESEIFLVVKDSVDVKEQIGRYEEFCDPKKKTFADYLMEFVEAEPFELSTFEVE